MVRLAIDRQSYNTSVSVILSGAWLGENPHDMPEGARTAGGATSPAWRFLHAAASRSGRIAAIGLSVIARRGRWLVVLACAVLSWTSGARPALAQTERPRVGVAFGGGSARGLAHVGIIA